ncbi:MAG: DUF4145 domain-containing protein [Oscillospiraceae bacterium]|nr:DUF4145 domain-containing protein [Oscillospiraceae bacterium]
MKEPISAINLENPDVAITMPIEKPRICPVCRSENCANSIIHLYYSNDNPAVFDRPHDALHSLYYCNSCHEVFLRRSRLFSDSHNHYWEDSSPIFTPRRNTPMQFPDAISALSAKFVEIYHQAETTEALGLYEVCGPAYRKALEFLVIDYCCSVAPEQTKAIQSKRLADVITGIKNESIKTLANGAKWIGNNETHYENTNDSNAYLEMKLFISTLINIIISEPVIQSASRFYKGSK